MNESNNSNALIVYVDQNPLKKRLLSFKADIAKAMASVYMKRRKQLFVFLALHLLFLFFGSCFCASDSNAGAVIYNLLSCVEYKYAISFVSVVIALCGISMLGKPISCVALFLESFSAGTVLSYMLKTVVNGDKFSSMLTIVLISVFSFVLLAFCTDVFNFHQSVKFIQNHRLLFKRILFYSFRSVLFVMILQIVLFLLFKF